jgi:tartrate-resistant acid phosphatase type 5
MRRWLVLVGLAAAGLSLLAAGLGSAAPGPATRAAGTVRVAVIGDYGSAAAYGPDEAAVAALVASWAPDFVLTVGDNNYEDGAASTIDANIGQYYHGFIYPYTGTYGAGAAVNRFFPSLGNHDWSTIGAQPYLDYFALPGNERYYDFAWGPLHIFTVDSDSNEPDGIVVTSTQAAWLQQGLAASTEPWNLVTMHHPPYSSGIHGPTPALQWPYAAWGADAVFAGHDHHYERILRDGIAYFVDGSGGRPLRPAGGPYTVDGSQSINWQDHGAILVEASSTHISFQFISANGSVLDTYTLDKPSVPTDFTRLPLLMSQN